MYCFFFRVTMRAMMMTSRRMKAKTQTTTMMAMTVSDNPPDLGSAGSANSQFWPKKPRLQLEKAGVVCSVKGF